MRIRIHSPAFRPGSNLLARDSVILSFFLSVFSLDSVEKNRYVFSCCFPYLLTDLKDFAPPQVSIVPTKVLPVIYDNEVIEFNLF